MGCIYGSLRRCASDAAQHSLRRCAGGSRRLYERHWTPVHLDVVVPGLTAEEALSGAPASEQQRFSVPRILGDEQ